VLPDEFAFLPLLFGGVSLFINKEPNTSDIWETSAVIFSSGLIQEDA
jgi:hypothetical protein